MVDNDDAQSDSNPFLSLIQRSNESLLRHWAKVGEEIARITPVVAGEESLFLIAVGYKLVRSKK